MTTIAARRPGGLIDRRLAARATVTRRYLVTAVMVGLIATVSVVVQAVLLGSVVSEAILHHATLGDVAPRLAGLGAAFLARGLCTWAGESAAQRTSAAVISTLRRQLLRHTLELGPSWLAGERAGELSLAATRGTAALDTYFGRYLPQAVLAALSPAVILAWVGWEDWASLLILLGLVALVPVAMVFFGRESAERTRKQWRRLSSLSARFLELVRGLPTLRAYGREGHGRREVAGATEALRQTTMGALRVAFLSALSLEFLAGIGTGLVAMVLGLRLLGGTVSLYTALAVLLVSPEVFLPLRKAGAEFHASAEGQAAADRILSVLDLDAGRNETAGVGLGPHASEEAGIGAPAGVGGTAGVGLGPRAAGEAGVGAPAGVGGTAGVGLGPRAAGEPGVGAPAGLTDTDSRRAGAGSAGSASPIVDLRGVTVRYPGRDRPAILGLDLCVRAGEHVALVGPSGAGKSTVAGLLLGFVRPAAGQVVCDGADLAEAGTSGVASWRRQVAWVPQRPHLVHGSLADNLRLGDPSASEDRLREVLAAVGLEEMVAGLPSGLATPVGEGGLMLSAGERQRVALARAALREAPLVVLDEPVAHLDLATEAALRRALDPWLSGRAVLVAAHRPELVERIDRVVTLSPPGQATALDDGSGLTAAGLP